MRRNIFIHQEYIDPENILSFEGFDVFICIDDTAAKKPLIQSFEATGVTYLDSGMGVEIVDDSLIATMRVTTGTPELRRRIEERDRISFRENNGNDVYDSNIQIAVLNA